MKTQNLILLSLLTLAVGAGAETNVVSKAFSTLSTYLRGPVASAFPNALDARCRTVASGVISILNTRPAGYMVIVR